MRVKFIVSPDYNNRGRIINPAYYFLRCYYKFKSEHYDKINWLDAHFDYITDNESLIKKIIDEKVDVLCLSIYIWNKNQYLTIASEVKKINPNIIIIAGGPELDSYKNKNFWNEHPMLDYVVYGDGELAFKFLLDHLVSNESLDKAVNLVTREKIYPFKVFNDPEFSVISPWLEMKDDIIRLVKEANGEKLLFNWEISRGCPYECSFCDWTSGLHTKVKRRKGNWREEIDLFAELGVQVGVIDANWGIYKEDLEIHDYAVEKLGDKYWTQNFSKLNKKAVYEMIARQGQGRLGFYDTNISIQDVNPEVLKNIDRPEIPWDEHKVLIQKMLKENPKVRAMPEVIIGLPGQTVDSFLDTIYELADAGSYRIIRHGWVLLTNSPANKPEYQEKFKLKIEDYIWLANVNFPDRKSVLQSAATKDNRTFIAKTVVGTYSCTLEDILAMHNLVGLFNAVKEKFPKLDPYNVIKKSKSKIIDLSAKHAMIMKQDKIFGIENHIGFVDYKNLWFHIDLHKILKSV